MILLVHAYFNRKALVYTKLHMILLIHAYFNRKALVYTTMHMILLDHAYFNRKSTCIYNNAHDSASPCLL